MCGKAESPNIDATEFQQMLEEGGRQMYSGDETYYIRTLKDKVYELLSDQKYVATLDIHWNTSQSNQRDQPIHNWSQNKDLAFFSEQLSMSIKCHIRTFMMKNWILILVGSGMLCSLVFKIRSFLADRQVKSVSNDLYKTLKTDLQAMGRGVAGIQENEMLQKYLTLPQERVG